MQKRANGLLSWFLTGDRVDNELRRYPGIKAKLDLHNTNALFLSVLCLIFLVVNFIVTACLLFSVTYHRYGGSITVISLLSNTLLILIRVVTWVMKAKTAHDEGSAISIFMTIPKCANAIDKDYLFSNKYYIPEDDDDEDDDDDFAAHESRTESHASATHHSAAPLKEEGHHHV